MHVGGACICMYNIHAYMHLHKLCVYLHVYIHACTHAYIHMYTLSLSSSLSSIEVSVFGRADIERRYKVEDIL